MRYVNNTSTEIRLVSGDVRDASERFVVIGRDPLLRSHYQQLTGHPFRKLPAWWMQDCPVDVARAEDRSLHVFATTFRPSDSARRVPQQVKRLQSAIEYPLARMMALCDAQEVAMTPISCRAPDVVAAGMVRIIWDISVAAFLDVSGPFKETKPTRFTIYSTTDLQPFIDVLDRGHYASMSHSLLFNTEVRFNQAKRTRYFARRKFKYRRAADGS